jgi:hypothetical protein
MVSGLHGVQVIAIPQPMLMFDDVADLDKAAEMVSRTDSIQLYFLTISLPRTPVEF